jgi:hypothetical protein
VVLHKPIAKLRQRIRRLEETFEVGGTRTVSCQRRKTKPVLHGQLRCVCCLPDFVELTKRNACDTCVRCDNATDLQIPTYLEHQIIAPHFYTPEDDLQDKN